MAIVALKFNIGRVIVSCVNVCSRDYGVKTSHKIIFPNSFKNEIN